MQRRDTGFGPSPHFAPGASYGPSPHFVPPPLQPSARAMQPMQPSHFQEPGRQVSVPGLLGFGGTESSPARLAYGLLSLAGTAAGAYHGYKRNDSVGWAIGWALLGGIFPFITIPVSVAQGFGERKRG